MDRKEIFRHLPSVLLPWYEENRRDLPWRQDPTPYHVWVSEIMLQQTRVEAVKGYYRRFLDAFPTVDALAKADDERLQKLWEGLGYYSRVRNMKKTALILTEQYGGQFPDTPAELMKLPGIGGYTAGAICSIAFGKPTPAVDGNVLRVLSRLTDDHTPVDLPAAKKNAQTSLIYPENAAAFTQALMELGATVCVPNRKPDCHHCPCFDFCAARLHGDPESLPVRLPKRKRREEDITVLILSCGGKYALQKRPDSGLLAGLWQFPDLPGTWDGKDAVSHLESSGLSVRQIFRQTDRDHIFTHVVWHMRGIYLELAETDPRWTWMTLEEIDKSAALPTAFRRFREEIPHV